MRGRPPQLYDVRGVTDTLDGHAKRARRRPITVRQRMARMDLETALYGPLQTYEHRCRMTGKRNAKNPHHPWRRHDPYR